MIHYQEPSTTQSPPKNTDTTRRTTTTEQPRLLEMLLHAAVDPNKTSPAHAINWHQPTALLSFSQTHEDFYGRIVYYRWHKTLENKVKLWLVKNITISLNAGNEVDEEVHYWVKSWVTQQLLRQPQQTKTATWIYRKSSITTIMDNQLSAIDDDADDRGNNSNDSVNVLHQDLAYGGIDNGCGAVRDV
ncbi:hypothetical protein BC941DRAFT_470598 [Chlamydoabsidia padenii]|nr:hypothetical protein BC941DRAFT_470598 [Chlamydoabsidia padenii]